MALEDSGFDILISNGVSFIQEDPQVVTGPSWTSIQLDVSGETTELTNYRFAMKYWELDGSDQKEFKNWKLVSQSITAQSVFKTEVGNEVFATPTQPEEIVTPNSSAQGGITDGVKLDYLKVFNESRISYLPRCATTNTPYVSGVYFPDGEVDPSLPTPQFPMDAIGEYSIDEREEVTITYEVTTQYSPWTGTEYGPVETYVFTITQKCTQDISDVGGDLQALMAKTYFGNGFFHTDLYELDAPPNYDEFGNVIGEVKEPIYREVINDDGEIEYELVNGVEVVPDIDLDQIEREEERQRRQVEGLLAGLERVIEHTQIQYEQEFPKIGVFDEVQAEVDRNNKTIRSKILYNLSSQQGVDYSYLEKLMSDFEWTPEMVAAFANNNEQ